MISVPIQGAGPSTSDYPYLSRTDVAVCLPHFEKSKAEYVAHKRLFAERTYDRTRAQMERVRADEIERMDTLEWWAGQRDGFDGENLDNYQSRHVGKEGLEYWKRAFVAPVGPPVPRSKAHWGTLQNEVEVDRCVARVYLTKYYSMHPKGAPAEFAGSKGETSSKLAGGPLEAGGNAVPPLRPTVTFEDHNAANEASRCLELITKSDFERRGVSSTMGAVFRNRCAYPVETRWCIGASCARGYDNLATMPASKDRGISYDAPVGVKTETRWAGCRLGFVHRPDFAGTLDYACK